MKEFGSFARELSKRTNQYVRMHMCVLVCRTPRFSPDCIPESFCHPAPGRWWWSEPRRCWQRRTGTRRSRPRKKQTFPSGSPDSAPCSPLLHLLSAAEPWRKQIHLEWMFGGRKEQSMNNLWCCLLRPPLSSWDSEKCEESPADVVVVKLVSPPLSPLHLLFVSAVVNVVASVGSRAACRSLFHFVHWLNQEF